MTGTALVVEDTPEFAVQARAVLERAGFDVEVVETGQDGLAAVARLEPDLVLLDLNLPDLDGLEVCRRLRALTGAYLIMVTARTGEQDLAEGFAAGADDYVTKPFSVVELDARIGAVMRRPRRRTTDTGSIGGLSIEVERREVSHDGETASLTRTEFAILRALAAESGSVLPRDDLARMLWGTEWGGSSHAIDAHVSNLRRKLRTVGWDGRVASVRGAGLRLVTPAG